MPVQKILLPLDLSKFEAQVIPRVVNFARQFQALVYVLTVAPDMTALSNFYPPHARFQEQVTRRTERQLQTFVTEHLADLPRVEPRVLIGRAAEKILEAARELAVDLIIMASHGHTGLKHLILGSVAEEVARRAPCPVTIIRAV